MSGAVAAPETVVRPLRGACPACGGGCYDAPPEGIRCDGCNLIYIGTMLGPQDEFVRSDARYPFYAGGRGSGKTYASILKMLRYAHEHPGARMMLTQPTINQIGTNLLPTITDVIGEGKGTDWVYLEKKGEIHFPALGVCVYVRTASEPDTMRGVTIAAGGLDEAAIGDQFEAFRIMEPALRQKGYPHQLWLTSTPSVSRKWIKQIWVDHVEPLTERSMAPEQYPIFFGDTRDNYYLPEWQRTELLGKYEGSRWGAQELSGQFIAVEGVAFPELSEKVHLRHPHEGIEFTKTVVGLDFGATSPTALIEWKMDRSKRLWATAEFYKRDATDYDWIAWCRDRNVNKIVCDPSAAERDLDFYRRSYGINIQRSRIKNFDDRARLWRSRLAVKEDNLPGLYISPSCPNLWDEMINLQFHKPRGHEYAADAFVPGSSDHAYDAGAYGLGEFEAGARGRPIQALVFQRRVA